MNGMSASKISRMIRRKEIMPSEVCAAFLSRCEETQPALNAFITLDGDAAMARAKELDGQPVTPETPAVFGLPVAVKDNICTCDMPATCASKMLETFRPPYDATVVSRLKKQGAVIIGKTNMDEFGMGSCCMTSAFGPVRNPHDPERVPGGSSGGSAAAVASGSAALALGSDTGGSIRLPASFCGTVGYKPTYGAVSRYGLIAYAGSFDQIGPITRTVEDAALLAGAVTGHDPLDTTSSLCKLDFSSIDDFDVKGKKIGIVKECFTGVSGDVGKSVNAAIETYRLLGAEMIECSLPLIEHSLPVYYILTLAESSSNLGRYDGLRFGHRSAASGDIESLYTNSRTEGFGAVVRQRAALGTYLLSAGQYEAYYKKALAARGMLCEGFKALFKTVDALITPVSPVTAFKLDEKPSDAELCLIDQCTVPVNIAGLPAVSVPCAKDRNGLPIGFQLIGNRFEDAALLGFARAYERGAEQREQI